MPTDDDRVGVVPIGGPFRFSGRWSVAPKLVDITIVETSGVDHPAHLHEGWIVKKSTDLSAAEGLLKSVADALSASRTAPTEETPVPETAVAEKDARIAALEAELAVTKAAMPAPAPAPEPTLEDFLKSAPAAVRKALDDANERATAAEAAATAAKATADAAVEVSLVEAAVEKAKTWDVLPVNAAEIGPMLRSLEIADAPLAKSVVQLLDAANEAAKTGGIFKARGSDGSTGSDGTAWGEITALAKAAVKADPAKSEAEAISEIADARPDLYDRYLSER